MRNKFEERIAKELGPEYEYEPVKLPYTLECSYTPDFVNLERREIIEAKGLFDAADRRKMKAIRAQYPGWTIKIVFQNPNRKISKQSKTTYGDWCNKNGIDWS